MGDTMNEYYDSVGNGPALQPGEEMKHEKMRLASFQNWPPESPARPSSLARCGFYYQNKDDEVRCFSCKVTLKKWKRGENPASEHKKWASECAVVTGRDKENVPMLPPSTKCEEKIDAAKSDQSSPDTAQMTTPSPKSISSILFDEFLYRNRATPKHPHFSRLENRIATYEKWPSNSGQEPRVLAEAGFFYSGSVHLRFITTN